MSPLSATAWCRSRSAARSARRTVDARPAPELAQARASRSSMQVSRPTGRRKMVVFAVDEGILQVARYKTPDPLGFFFQKRALEVRTVADPRPDPAGVQQADGGAGARRRRRRGDRRQPESVQAQARTSRSRTGRASSTSAPKERELTYDVPDYFNGTLRVMAVAVAADAIGTFEKRAIVRGDFVISPNVPMVAAPGRRVRGHGRASPTTSWARGKGASVTLALEDVQAPGGRRRRRGRADHRRAARRRRATFKLKATAQLGSASADVHRVARGQDRQSSRPT